MRRLALLPLLLLLVVQAGHSATYVSRATGNWNATGTWAIQRTGTITTSTASATVTGSGTLFTTELAANNVLYTAAGVAIGTVKSITNATTLVLTANAASTNTGVNYFATSPSTPSVAADVVTINSPHTVTGNAAVTITSVTINTGGTLSQSSNLGTSGALNVQGTFNITNGTMTFGGLVTITNGTWNNSGNRPVTFQGGLTFNGGTFTSGTGTTTFGTNNQSIDGTTGLTFSGTVSIASSIVVTNKNDGVVRMVSAVTAGNASSTWINDVDSTVQVEGAFMTAGILTASASGNTVNYASTLAQTVKVPSGTPATYYNLTLSGASTKTMPSTAMTISNDFVLSGTTSATAAQALTVNGDINIGSGTTFNGNIFSHSVKGDFTNSGTFTALSSTITFNGSGTQTLTGSTTFFNVTVSNSGGGLSLAASTNMTLGTSGTLVLTSGKITTGSNFVITPRACNVPSVTRTGGWVNGNLRKAIPAGASTCTFEIGDANNYAPAVFTFPAGTGAGNLTASTTGTDHPQTGTVTSGIDPSNSVNRYWTFTNGGVTLPAATGYTVSLHFINGSTVDVDSLASVGSYSVEQWDGASWFPATVSASCTAVDGSHLCKTASSESGFGDFAIGGFRSGFNGIPGQFNTMETTASTSQILGRLYTKLAGTAFQVSVVAVDTTFFVRNNTPSTNQLTIDIIDSSGTPGTFDSTTNCWSGWVPPARAVIQSQTLTPSWTSGGLTVTINAPTRAIRDARIRITQTVGAATRQGCSVDRFSVRPANFTVSSTNANNTSQSGGTTIRTGGNFQLTATAVQSNGTTAVTAGYDGTPAIDNSKIIGSPNAGAIGGNFSAATGSAASGITFYYSEVGNFGLNIGGVFDSSYTSVDQSTDCVAGDFSNTLSGGKYGCSIGNALIAQNTGVSGFGRFIPDNFAISLNSPQFSTTCGTFSYVGQSFTYTTGSKPVITVTARNGTNNGLGNATTLNYANSNPSYQYMKLSNSADPLIISLNKSPYSSQGGRYTRFDALGGGATPTLDTSALPGTDADPTIGTFTDGVGTLTFSDAGFKFTRGATPDAEFSADIALAIKVIDSDSVEPASNPVTFGSATSGGGIAFSGGKPFRFGILRLLDAFAPLTGFSGNTVPVGVRAEYWTGTAFATNTSDSCTTLTEKNFVLYAHGGQITTTNLPTPTAGSNGAISLPSATLSAGLARVNVAAPSGGSAITQPGNARICMDLDASSPGNDSTCGAVTQANKAHLQGAWSGTTYSKDPSARIGFGLYGAQPNNFIFFRENY